MRVVGMASLPDREDAALKSVESIINQVDKVYVALNGYDHIPLAWQDNPKIHCDILDNSLGDAAKFYHIADVDGWYFSIDDDLAYPSNYCNYMISKAEQYKCIVTLHGRRYGNPNITSSRRGWTLNYHCLHSYSSDELLHVGGTGVMCFHTDIFRPSIDRFKVKNMADFWCALQAKEQKVKIMGVAHKNNFLRYMPPKVTIWQTCTTDRLQTDILKKILK